MSNVEEPKRPIEVAAMYTAVVLAWVALYSPWIAGTRALPWDSYMEFFPNVVFNAAGFRSGDLPWWNPHLFSGYPQVADPQGMMFSPLLMGWMVAHPMPSLYWFDNGVLLHLLMGGLGFVWAMRGFELNGWSGVLGSLVFMAGGTAASRLQHTPMILAYAYFPWLLGSFDRLMRTKKIRWGVAVGVVSGVTVLHMTQLTYLLFWIMVAYAVVRIYQQPCGIWPALGTAGGLGAAIVAIPLGTVLAFVRLSQRPKLPLEASMSSSLTPKVIATLAWPNFFHALGGDYTGPADRTEAFLYLGTLPALVLLAALVLSVRFAPRGWRRETKFFITLAIVASLFVLGPHYWFYRALFRYLPGLNLFRRPTDGAFIFNIACAVLVTIVASWASSSNRLRYPRQAGVLWLAVGAIWLANIAGAQEHAWWPARLAAIAAISLAFCPGRHVAALALVSAGIVCISDFRVFNLGGTLNGRADQFEAFKAADEISMLRTRQNHETPLPFRFEWRGPKSEEWENGAALAGVYSAAGYNALLYRPYRDLYGVSNCGCEERPYSPFNRSETGTLARLSGAKFLVTNEDPEQTRRSYPQTRLTLLRDGSSGGQSIWENADIYNRVLTPRSVSIVKPGGSVTPELFDATNFNEKAWLFPSNIETYEQVSQDAARCTGQAVVRGGSYGNSRVRVDVEVGKTPAWLVLSELDFPGWRASSHGQALPIYRANLLYRAICLPAGASHVEFSFSPTTLIADSFST